MPEKIQKATHDGTLKIGDNEINCAVLEDGTRVLTRTTFIKAIGRKGKAKGGREYDDEFKTPVFLTAQNLKSFVTKEMIENSMPVIFMLKGKTAIGYKAELLPQTCGVFIDAYEAGVLKSTQYHIYEECKSLLRGFATIGIIALVDEVTGFEKIRDRLALQKILDKYLTDEWAKWTKTFPNEYYRQLFKLKGMPYPPPSDGRKPQYIGHWTNDIVYSRLAPGVLKALKEKTPKAPSGSRIRKFHQHLTREFGHPELREHLSNVIFLMKTCTNWDDFKRRLNRARPKCGDKLTFDFKDENP